MPAFTSISAIRFIVFTLVLILVAGCSYSPKVGPAPKADQGLMLLGPGDRISLVVYGEDTLTGSYMLDEDGNINVPLAGAVKAGGLTKSALQEKISTTLKKQGFQQNPYVTVEIEALRPFYIIGEVNKPGNYPYQPTLDVFQAVAMAGGYTPRASTNRILVTRTKQGEKTRFYASEETPIWPGDSIMIYQRLF